MKNRQNERDRLNNLRKQHGALIRQRRKALSLSQRQLAARLALEPYTIIDQIEQGIGRIEPFCYQDWADALELPLRKVVADALRHLDPVAHDLFVPYELHLSDITRRDELSTS